MGKVLERSHQVNIHGFSFSGAKNPVWAPCDTGEFDYKAINGRQFPRFLGDLRRLFQGVNGDVIYVSKLRTPSYGIGLLGKYFKSRPLLLDVDDLEVSWSQHLSLKEKFKDIRNPCGQLQTEIIEKLAFCADEITTVSERLKRRYGRGIFIPHGKDTEKLNPEKIDSKQLRTSLGLEETKIVMFLGTPRPHKGLEEAVEAIKLLGRHDTKLVVVGAGADKAYESHLQCIGGEDVILHPQIPFNQVPLYLKLADVVVIPQRDTLPSRYQIPAKLIDAMAMAKPIVATDVSDIAEILDKCGVVVAPGDVEGMARGIGSLLDDRPYAENLGIAARKKCVSQYSWDVMEKRLNKIIASL